MNQKFLLLITGVVLNIFIGSSQERVNLDLSSQPWSITLDRAAVWQNDELYLPPIDIKALPVNTPTGGWQLLKHPDKTGINLPATVEEHLWGWNGQTFGVTGNYTGVSWFETEVDIPAEWKNRRIAMNIGSVRFRAEIFVNHQLAGYDLVNSTPFSIDITPFIEPGKKNVITFRITDPNGNFNWKDSQVYTWGVYRTNPSHGFGGITGKVELEATGKLYVKDVFIKNQPEPHTIEVEVRAANETGTSVTNKELCLEIKEHPNGQTVYRKNVRLESLKEGENLQTYQIKVPNAHLWSVDSPRLYDLKISLNDDAVTERFGFRWFEIKDVKGDRQFFLNGKRIVLRTAISWGFWPYNGITPSDELAKRQITIAKELGLNMLNFHRNIGQTNILDYADELGLLYFEEPGGNQYPIKNFNDNDKQSNFYFAYRNEKLARSWAFPGKAGLEHRVGGLEKDKLKGSISTDAQNHQEMTNLRAAKVAKIADYIPHQTVYGDPEGDLLVVGWGGTRGHLQNAVDKMRAEGKKVSLCHFNYINPLPRGVREIFARFRRIVVCELNEGQFASYLRSSLQEFHYEQYNKCEGQPFTVVELRDKFESLLK